MLHKKCTTFPKFNYPVTKYTICGTFGVFHEKERKIKKHKKFARDRVWGVLTLSSPPMGVYLFLLCFGLLYQI